MFTFKNVYFENGKKVFQFRFIVAKTKVAINSDVLFILLYKLGHKQKNQTKKNCKNRFAF